MPGLVGLITKRNREWAEPQLTSMVETLRHESFYTTGTWLDESLGLYVGWAMPEHSFADALPIFNEANDVVLFFAGEEFPEPGTASRLRESGHVVNTTGPSYLVHLYEDDPNFPSSLNGRFHGLIVDRRNKKTILFDDRYGMHRVHYHESNAAFYFAAEAKAILKVRPETRCIEPRSMGEQVSCGCVFEDRTLFQGISVLPRAAAWVFRGGSIRHKNVYFEPREWEVQEPLGPKAYYENLREIFSRSLPRYLSSDEHVGMSLTGGLDTRMIMAWQRSAVGTLPCYTFAGMYRDCHDVLVARNVAQTCGQPYQTIPVGQDFLAQFSDYAERSVYLSDGCVDVSRSPDLYVQEKARRIAPVRIAGTYGSEVLRSVRAFKPTNPPPGLFSEDFLFQIAAARQIYSELAQVRHPASFAVFRPAPQHGVEALERTQLAVRTPFLDNELVRTVFRAPQSQIASGDIFADNDVCLRLIADGNPALLRIRTDRGLAGPPGKLSAALARALAEFTFKSEYAYDYGMPQSVAKIDHILSALHLERLFLGRHKFYHFRLWYRDNLSRYIQEILLDRRTLSRPYLNARTLEMMVRRHVKGDQNYTSSITSVLSMELTHRLFLEN
jgi:asparagine synthase (glutamine-hydrolysing)